MKTFALGLGCQKGGTSWLHEYLASSPVCAPGFRKEFHVWDGLDLASEAWMRRRVMDRAARTVALLHEGKPAPQHALRQAGFYADPSSYFDYFETLLHRPGVELGMDITPSYALIAPERLSMIRAEFIARQIRVVPVFLLRDPVERVWSMVRMNQQRRPEQFPGDAADWVATLYQRDDHALRTRYDRTLANLDASFPGESWVGFYEELFTEPVLRDLCARLGIDYIAPDVDHVVNAAPKSGSLPPALVAEVAEHFRPVYQDAAARFGWERVQHLWPSARALA